MFVFPVAVQLGNSEHTDLIRKGNLRIEGGFKEATQEALTVVIFVKFPALLEVNLERSVKLQQP